MRKYEIINEILNSRLSEERKAFLLRGISLAKKKRWICEFNDNTCDWCMELHGKLSDDDGKWTKEGYTITPGEDNHAGCNCSWEYV